MIRFSLHRNTLQKTILQISKQNSNQCIRWQSTNAQKNNKLKFGLMVGSSVVVLSSVSIVYSKYDNKFRKRIENSIPYSELLLNSLLGPIVEKNNSKIDSINELKDKAIEASFMRKKEERNKSLNQSENTRKNIQIIETNSQINGNKKKEEISSQESSKSNEKVEKPETPLTSPPKEDIKEEKPEPSKELTEESTLLDIDVLIAREALKEQLLNLLPTEDEKVELLQQEILKRESDRELEFQRKISKLEENFEQELRKQSKRQLSIFNDHLQEQLSTLRHELKRKNQNIMEEKILNVKSELQSELSDSFYRLQRIETILKVREQLDREERTAKELWVLSRALRDSLRHNSSSTSDKCLPLSLNSELSAVKEVLKKDLSEKPLIKIALESIPKDAFENGVYSEEDLIKRFSKVDRICKRVALIGDNGGTLFQYILSYLQSFMVFTNSNIPLEELEDQEIVDPSKWDTFDILIRVSHCLKNHNLEMALRYANQLRGEPRNVAQDWIRDTRIHLEMKQVVDLLQVETNFINVQVLS